MLETQMVEQAARSRLGNGEGGDAGSGCEDTQSVSSRNAESASASASASSALGSTALSSLPLGAEAEAPGQQAAEQPHAGLQAHESQQRPTSARLAGPQKFDRPMDFR